MLQNNTPYIRQVHYYETDQMGIVHHSNYVRWMEEARLAHFNQYVINYAELESMGIIIPVVGVSCSYKKTITYGDTVKMYSRISYFNGVKAVYEYTFYLEDEKKPSFIGSTKHCFLDERTRKPVNLKKRLPELYDKMMQIFKTEEETRRKL